MKQLIINILYHMLFLLVLFRIECVEKKELESLTDNDFWPNEVISSKTGVNLELFTGLPYALKKGSDGTFIKEIVILPTLNANQYLIKFRGMSRWFGRRRQIVNRKYIADIKEYYGNWNGKEMIRYILSNNETSETTKEDNKFYWTFDKECSPIWNTFFINSCHYTNEVLKRCGPLAGICSASKKVDGGYVAPYYNFCNITYEFFGFKFENIPHKSFGFEFEPLFTTHHYPLQLEAFIYDIEYEESLDKVMEKYAKQQEISLSKMTVINDNTFELRSTFSYSHKQTHEFSNDFHDVWSNFHSVHVDIGDSIDANAGFSGLFSRDIIALINSGYKYSHQQTTGWATKKIISKKEKYSISKQIIVPRHSIIKVSPYVNFFEKVPVKVKLIFKITSIALRENLNNESKRSPLDADVVTYLMKQRGMNSRIKIVGRDKDAVLGELDGIIVASFGVDIGFRVVNGSENEVEVVELRNSFSKCGLSKILPKDVVIRDVGSNRHPNKEPRFHNTLFRVVNGISMRVGQIPWMCAIYFNGQFKCGGTIIGKRHILSAAHCFKMSLNPIEYHVRVGSVKLNDGTLYRLSKIKIHEEYFPPHKYHDIAILTVENKIDFNDEVSPVCLPTRKMFGEHLYNKTSFVAGYGDLSYHGAPASTLQEVDLKIMNNSYCEENYMNLHEISQTYFPHGIKNSMICAGHEQGGKDSCHGDSGGPLTITFNGRIHLIGIVSFGNKCGLAGFPGIYTCVSYYLDWIWRNLILTQ